MCSVTDKQAPTDIDPLILYKRHLFHKDSGIDHNTVANDTSRVGPENTGWNLMENNLCVKAASDYDMMYWYG